MASSTSTTSYKQLQDHVPCHVKLMRSASLPNVTRGPWCVERRSRIFELLSPASACPPCPRLRPCRGRRGRLTVVDVVDAWTRTGRTSWTSWTRTGKKFHPTQKPGTEAPCDGAYVLRKNQNVRTVLRKEYVPLRRSSYRTMRALLVAARNLFTAATTRDGPEFKARCG